MRLALEGTTQDNTLADRHLDEMLWLKEHYLYIGRIYSCQVRFFKNRHTMHFLLTRARDLY